MVSVHVQLAPLLWACGKAEQGEHVIEEAAHFTEDRRQREEGTEDKVHLLGHVCSNLLPPAKSHFLPSQPPPNSPVYSELTQRLSH
jgi:hypothetical protein